MNNERVLSLKLYVVTLCVTVISLILMIMCYGNSAYETLIVILLCVTGINNIYRIYKIAHVFVTPLSIMSLIWYIVIPLTSYPTAMMEKMSLFQWKYCLAGMIFFCIGGVLCSAYSQKFLKSRENEIEEWKIKEGVYQFCMALILLGIVLYLIQGVVAGGFPIFSSNPGEAAKKFYLPGCALLSSLGLVGIYLIFCDKEYRKKKVYIALSIIYLMFQILLVVRFTLFLVIIMLLSTMSINKNRKNQFKIMVVSVIVCIVAFVVVLSFRGGSEDKQKYFIDTGKYNGTAQELVQTEILRYFGMSQRTMESYMETYSPGCSKMGLTFSPILESLGIEVYNPKRYGLYGYTATNIITNMYFDAGFFWWLLMIVWSFVMNLWYFGYKNRPHDILNKFLWSIATIGMTMSFYCYINAYTYWYFHFIIAICLLRRWRIRFCIKRK